MRTDMRPRNPTHQPHDRFGCCICNGKHCCCQCDHRSVGDATPHPEVRSPNSEVRTTWGDPPSASTEAVRLGGFLSHQYVGEVNARQMLVNVYVDGSATVQFRAHEFAGWDEPLSLDRREV